MRPGDVLADFWYRVAATLIDVVVLLVPLLVILFILVALGVTSGLLTGTGDDGFQARASFGGGIVGILVHAAYTIPLIARGQTVGMMVMKTHAISEGGGEPPGPATSAVRWLVPYGATQILSLIPLLGFIGLVNLLDVLWMLWDPKKQTLHDKVARTLVVRRAGPTTVGPV
jgi:uncharacterized RDD family membrane protein YckC